MELNYMEDCSEEQVSTVVQASHITVVPFRNGKILFVKRRNSTTLELPVTEKLPDEKPRESVRRLLSEKLGIMSAQLEFVTAYARTDGTEIDYGLLYFADIDELGPFPYSDLVSAYYLDTPPEDKDKWSYPDIQISMLEKVMARRKR